MDNFTSKTKQHRVLGINLLRFSSIVLLISVGVNAGTRTDTLYTSGGAYLTRMSTPSAGITRANIDTSKTRAAAIDSVTIPVFKGNETHRGDSVYFAGIARFAGTLYAPVVDIDSLVGNVKVGGSLGIGTSIVTPTSNYKSIKIGNNQIISRTSAAEGLYINANVDFNGTTWIKPATGRSTVLDVAPTGVRFYFSQSGSAGTESSNELKASLDTNGALTTSTLNTGNGDNELYPMNQAVRTTDDVTHDSATVTDLKVLDDATIDDDLVVGGGITIAGGSQLTNFSKGTFVCSLYVNNNTEFIGYGTVQYQVVDSVVTLRFPYISGTITTSGTKAVNVRNVPVALRSSKTEQYVPVTMYENGGYGIGLFQAKSSSTYFAFTTSAVGSPATGTFTVNRCVVQYFL